MCTYRLGKKLSFFGSLLLFNDKHGCIISKTVHAEEITLAHTFLSQYVFQTRTDLAMQKYFTSTDKTVQMKNQVQK